MTATTIVDQAWEFGSAEWCQFAGELGVRLLAESDLDLDTFEWGFSEIYTHLPERLMAGRDQAAFHFHITGGKVYGGAGAPEENLALPGFHITCPWAAIAHASSYLYDFKGQRERGADEEVMWKELTELTGKPKGLAMDHQTESEGEPLCVVCGSSVSSVALPTTSGRTVRSGRPALGKRSRWTSRMAAASTTLPPSV
jgi:hypothetical protein